MKEKTSYGYHIQRGREFQEWPPPDLKPSSLGSINGMRSLSGVYDLLYGKADLKIGVGLI